MPPRSVKMKRRILGFQRRVWWPKWTPASRSSRIETTGTDRPLSVGLDFGRRGRGGTGALSGAGTATGRIRRVGCGNRGMVAEGGIWNESVPFALRRRMVRSRSSTVTEVDARANVVRVGTIGCFGGGAAVGALVPVPQKFEAAVGADWVIRAAQAFATFLALLCLLTVFDNGVIQARLPRAISTRSLAWADPVAAG